MSIKYNSQVLVSAAASTTGAWYPLDYKFNGSQKRALVARLDANAVSASDTIQIQLTPDEFKSDPTVISTIVTVTSFTTTEYNTILEGPWTAIRAVKTGAGGVGWVRFVG